MPIVPQNQDKGIGNWKPDVFSLIAEKEVCFAEQMQTILALFCIFSKRVIWKRKGDGTHTEKIWTIPLKTGLQEWQSKENRLHLSQEVPLNAFSGRFCRILNKTQEKEKKSVNICQKCYFSKIHCSPTYHIFLNFSYVPGIILNCQNTPENTICIVSAETQIMVY